MWDILALTGCVHIKYCFAVKYRIPNLCNDWSVRKNYHKLEVLEGVNSETCGSKVYVRGSV